MSDCIFCKIVTNEITSFTVFEDEHTRAFLDIFGATDGHLMVIHKRHEETLVSYTDEEVSQVFKTVRNMSAAVETAFETKILSIGINHGEPQGVHHMHVHIMPRFEGDGGGIIQQLAGRKPTVKDFALIAERLKKSLGK